MKEQKNRYIRNEDVVNDPVLIDAKNQTLGRLASEISTRLMGKHKANYTPSVVTGDFVVVINASQIKVTGNKMTDKIYYRHTGYAGGLKETALKDFLAKDPAKLIIQTVKGMLPKTKLGRKMLTNIRVYEDENQPHAGLKLTKVELGEV